MGTNFYWKNPGQIVGRAIQYESQDNPMVHIGKRNAAGPYCFDCGVTLIHNDTVTGFNRYDGRNKLLRTGQAGISDTCPECGKSTAKERLTSSAAGLELGFRQRPPGIEERQGARTCSSFSWAQDPGWVLAKLLEDDGRTIIVVDEYDGGYTAREFLWDILAACPIQFTDDVGVSFS